MKPIHSYTLAAFFLFACGPEKEKPVEKVKEPQMIIWKYECHQ